MHRGWDSLLYIGNLSENSRKKTISITGRQTTRLVDFGNYFTGLVVQKCQGEMCIQNTCKYCSLLTASMQNWRPSTSLQKLILELNERLLKLCGTPEGAKHHRPSCVFDGLSDGGNVIAIADCHVACHLVQPQNPVDFTSDAIEAEHEFVLRWQG